MTLGQVGQAGKAARVRRAGRVGHDEFMTSAFRRTLLALIACAAIGRILTAQSGDWLMYSGSYSSHRFSPLAQITTENVARLKPAWVYQPAGTGSLETTPVVVNGV